MKPSGAWRHHFPGGGMSGAVQLSLAISGQRPLDPIELAELSAPQRGDLYRALDLNRAQIGAAEDGVRQVLAGRYLREVPRS